MSAGARVFVFFSLGYLTSYVFRGLNIGFGPTLSAEMQLSASDLGVLTSLYFLGFAMMQLPAGLLLDTWGPRRVNAGMLVLAAVGTVVYGLADSMAGLMVGRLLIGAGVCVCLGATFQALAQNFPVGRLPLVNGLVMAVGGLGGVLVGSPLSWLLSYTTWRMVSVGLAVATLCVAALLLVGAPREPVRSHAPPSLREQWRGMLELLCMPRYWRLVSLPVATSGVFFGVQSLWVRPYLIDFNGLAPAAAAWTVSLLGFAMMAGNVGLGALARRAGRMGLGLFGFSGLCQLLFIVVQVLIAADAPLPVPLLWVGYGVFGSACILVFALLAAEFPPQLLGRIAATTNLLMFVAIFACQIGMGAILDLWPAQGGAYPPQAHRAAWLVLLALQVAAAAYYYWPRREAVASSGRG